MRVTYRSTPYARDPGASDLTGDMPMVSRRPDAVIRRTLVASAAAAGLVCIPAAPAIASSSQLHAIGAAPGVPAHAAALGSLPVGTPLAVDFILAARNPAALTRFATGVSTRGSGTYGHFLARRQFGSRFGASTTSVRAVQSALSAAGLGAGRLSANRLSIQVTATAGALARALHVRFERYRLAGGRIAYSTVGAARLPDAAASQLIAILGLTDVVRERPQLAVPRPHPRTAPPGAPSACPAADAVTPANQGAHANGQPGDVFLTGDKVASAYGVDPLFAAGQFGQSAHVAIYELEGNFPGDIPAYEQCFGIPASVAYAEVDGGAGAPSAANEDGLETELDVDNVINMAPDSTVTIYQGPNSGNGAYDTYSKIVNDDTATVISSSWGLCEDEEALLGGSSSLTAEDQLFEQAAAQGQSIIAASGDNGSEDCADPIEGESLPASTVDDPASQPFVTGAGGTRLLVGASGARSAETVWNDGPMVETTARGAGGGGVSSQWGMPVWQYKTLSDGGWLPDATDGQVRCLGKNQTADPSATSSEPYCREVPDVTANADPASGFVVYWNGGWTHVGGTSGAAPTWSGLTALANSCAAEAGRKPVGNLNASLYSIADDRSNWQSAFFDVTQGNNDYIDPMTGTLGFAAGPGYDMASGLGAPIAGGGHGVVDQLCDNAVPGS
jgi:subtilase family serine protease